VFCFLLVLCIFGYARVEADVFSDVFKVAKQEVANVGEFHAKTRLANN